MTSQENDRCDCASTIKDGMTSSANSNRIYRTFSKRTIGFYCIVILLLVNNASGARNNGKCPSVCTCNEDNTVFCNNKKLYITPIGFSSTVERLYLFNNNISSILPATLRPLMNLKILDISGNRLSDIALWDGIFTKLKLLENLMLQDNKITRINRGMFVGLNNLVRIYLFNNRIEVIESGSFDTLPNLIELKLGNNRITRFPRLTHTPRLLLLDLSGNRLATLRDMAFSTVNVEHLRLQNNKLTELRTSVFDDTSRLTHLDISNNRLTAVPQVIKSLTSLRSLNISHNKMDAKTIPQDTFANLESLKSLYLNGMGLQSLSNQLLPKGTIHLNRLDLTENDWDCKCKMRWMPDYMKTFPEAIISPSEVVCSQSSRLRGRKIMDLQERDFGCSSKELESTETDDVTTPLPTTPTSGGHFNLCAVFHCANDGVCYIENKIPKCRCTKDWAGTLCRTSLTTPPVTSTPSTTTAPTTVRTNSPQRPRLVIIPGSTTEETVEIIIPIRNKQLLLSISEIGQDNQVKEFNIVPKANLFTVQNLSPGRSYNICIHMPLDGKRSPRRLSSNRRDTLCGNVQTKGVKVTNIPASNPEITVVPSPKVTTKLSETPIQKQTSIVTKNTDESWSDPALDQKLRGSKITPQTEPADSKEFSMLYPAIGAGIGAVIVVIVVVTFCICRRQKRILKLKKSPNSDYTPGSATDTHNEVEMATVVHHHHHNHYTAGSVPQTNGSKSDQSSPASTMQNGSTSNAQNPKLSPSKTNNNNHTQSKSSRSSSRSSGVSQPDTRYTSIPPHLPALNPIQKYEQNGIPNGYNIYRDATQEQPRQSHRPIQQRSQNILPPSDSQPMLTGNTSYYEANDSHLYPVSPLGSPTYNIPSTGSANYNPPPGPNAHALFQPIQSPLATSMDSMPGFSHRLSSHALPPPMACLPRNLVVDNLPRYHEGVQVV